MRIYGLLHNGDLDSLHTPGDGGSCDGDWRCFQPTFAILALLAIGAALVIGTYLRIQNRRDSQERRRAGGVWFSKV